MGLMDKVKAQTATLAEKAQQGVAQGKDKIDDLQAKRAKDSLLEQLGAAVYANERNGAPREEVNRLLAELDAHDAAHSAEPTT